MSNKADQRPLVLLVTRNFPPLLGGMEKVNQQLLAALQRSWRTALCGPSGCVDYASSKTEVMESPLRPLPIFLLATLWRAVPFAWRRRPQWIIAGSGLTAPIAWVAARCSGARVAVYLHGLDIVAPSCIYQWLWLPFIRRCDLALVNSSNTALLANVRGVRNAVTHILHPGTDIPVLDANVAHEFRRRFTLGDRPLLLSVGRLTQRKGLVEFVSRVLPTIAKRFSNVLLLVIGDEASDALHARAGSERERILAAAREAGLESNLCFLGRCDNATLSAAYQTAAVHIFPVLDLPGDVEGFGMVALEAAAHGVPTIAFAVGGVSDAVLNGRTGALIEPGNYSGFGTAVIRQLSERIQIEPCVSFAASKTWSAFGERLSDLLGRIDD